MKQKIFKYLLTYLVLIIGFIVLLFLACNFSSEHIFNNVKASSEVLLNEGNRKIIYIPYRQQKMQFDNYTDALMINTAYSIDSSDTLYSAFIARKNYMPGVTTEIYKDSAGELKSSSKYQYHNEVGELNDLVNREKAESFEYARYWHGYLIILRPLLILFNITQIRVILTILLIILAFAVIFLIYKKTNLITSIIFFTGLVGIEYFYLGFSLQGIFVFLIMMISSIIMLLKYNKIKNFGLFFFTIGMLTNFFDFLTVPIVTLSIPLIIYFLLKKKEELSIQSVFKEIIAFTLAWGIGYGLTWFTKWFLTDILFDRNMISVALNQVLYRSTSKTAVADYNMFTVINENLKYIIIPLFISLITTFIIIYFNLLLNKNIKKMKPDKEQVLMQILPYIIILTFPFCWYIILQNHSYYHAFFTYRNLIITNICINIIIEKVFVAFFKEEKKNEK